MFACRLNVGANLMRRVMGDIGDFFQREALDGVQDESFALVAAGVAQRALNQIDQFVTCSDVFGTLR